MKNLPQDTKWTQATLGQFLSGRGKGIDARKTPSQTFELYSVPSHQFNHPELIEGSAIGSTKQLVETRNVLLCKINPKINRVWVVGDFSNHTKIASTEWIIFSPSDSVVSEFLCYFLQQNKIREFLASNVSGVGGSLMRVKSSILQNYPFAYPHFAEQKRIIAEIEKQFTRLDEGVKALKRAQANLKRYRAAVLKAACEGKLVPTEADLQRKKHTPANYETGEQLLKRILTERAKNWQGRGKYKAPADADTTNLPKLPEGWAWASLEQLLVLMRNGIATKPDATKGLPILRISAVRPLSVNLNEIRYLNAKLSKYADYALDEGDLLFTRYNGNPDLVGVCGVVPPLSEALVHPDKLIRCKLISVGVVPSFIAMMSNVGESRNYLSRRVRTTAGQSGISGGDLRGLPIPMPPLVEQQRIVAEVERHFSIISRLETLTVNNLARAIRLRQSILQKAFLGELI